MTWLTAISPEAPGRLRMTSEAPSPRCLAMKGARVRTITSVVPPAAKPTVTAMGASDGQAACAAGLPARARAAAAARVPKSCFTVCPSSIACSAGVVKGRSTVLERRGTLVEEGHDGLVLVGGVLDQRLRRRGHLECDRRVICGASRRSRLVRRRECEGWAAMRWARAVASAIRSAGRRRRGQPMRTVVGFDEFAGVGHRRPATGRRARQEPGAAVAGHAHAQEALGELRVPAAMRMSHMSARSQPAPIAGPLTAAMSALRGRRSRAGSAGCHAVAAPDLGGRTREQALLLLHVLDVAARGEALARAGEDHAATDRSSLMRRSGRPAPR